MSKDLNQCNFIGRLGRDPEIKFLTSGSALAVFSIGVGNKYKAKSGEMVDEVEWVNMTAFGKLAEIIGQYCKKGDKVYVSGRMKTDKYQDQNGNDKYSTKIIVNDLQMLGGKPQGQPQPQQHPSNLGEPKGMDDFDSDIPF